MIFFFNLNQLVQRLLSRIDAKNSFEFQVVRTVTRFVCCSFHLKYTVFLVLRVVITENVLSCSRKVATQGTLMVHKHANDHAKQTLACPIIQLIHLSYSSPSKQCIFPFLFLPLSASIFCMFLTLNIKHKCSNTRFYEVLGPVLSKISDLVTVEKG